MRSVYVPVFVVRRNNALSIITIRVREKLKRNWKYNVNVSETVRKVLDEHLEGLERKRIEEKLEKVKDRLGDKIDSGLFAKLVRNDKETRWNFSSIHPRFFRSWREAVNI